MQFMLEGTEVAYEPTRLVMAGYTGRNQEAVRKHVEELKQLGVPAPEEVPAFYPVPLDRLTQQLTVETIDAATSGEPEAVYFVAADDIWIGVGSDHTDREMEKTSIKKSKVLAPKPVSKELWSYKSVKNHWDTLLLRSWVGVSGRERLYQEGRLSDLLRPEELLSILSTRIGGDLQGLVVFGGTVPMLGSELQNDGFFAAELVNLLTGESLSCSYVTRILDYLP